jgi:hypothetical protein
MSNAVIGSVSTVMVRRDAFTRVPMFNESLAVLNDWAMYLCMAAAGMRFGHVPVPLVEYRWHGSNLSGDLLHMWSELCAVFDDFLATNSLPSNVQRRIRLRWWCAHWHLITAEEARRRGNVSSARRHIARAACAHPRSVRPGWVRLLVSGRAS